MIDPGGCPGFFCIVGCWWGYEEFRFGLEGRSY